MINDDKLIPKWPDPKKEKAQWAKEKRLIQKYWNDEPMTKEEKAELFRIGDQG